MKKRYIKTSLFIVGVIGTFYLIFVVSNLFFLFTDTHEEQSEIVGSSANSKWNLTAHSVRGGATLPNVVLVTFSSADSTSSEPRTLITFRANSDSVLFRFPNEDEVVVTLREYQIAPWKSYQLALSGTIDEIPWYEASNFMLSDTLILE